MRLSKKAWQTILLQILKSYFKESALLSYLVEKEKKDD